MGTFFLAKTAGVGSAAFLFEICRPKLMELAWFVRVYALGMRVRHWAHVQVEPFQAPPPQRHGETARPARGPTSGPAAVFAAGVVRSAQARRNPLSPAFSGASSAHALGCAAL